MRAQVLKPFTGERAYRVGEIVDATGWRLAGQLVAQRYLREVPEQSDDSESVSRRRQARS